jgi:hypothetical protein
LAGIVIDTVGFQLAVLSPTPAEPATTVWGEFESVTFVGVTVIVPVVVIVPGAYEASVAAMMFGPLVKSVCAAVTVQLADCSARSSVRSTGPIGALIVVPGAPEPRLTDTGALRDSAPDVTVKVIVVEGSTEFVSVPVYTPATALAGIVIDTVGSQDAVLSPTPSVPATTGVAVFESVTGVPVAVMVPVVVIVPGSYETAVAGMVSAGEPPPVVKSVAEVATVQLAETKARSSTTLLAPIGALIVVPGAPEPRSADAGTVMVRAPDVTVKVIVVEGSPNCESVPV